MSRERKDRARLRILVTGGAGFIGSHVAEACARAGHDVLVVDNLSRGRRENVPAGVAFEEIDLTDETQMARLFAGFRPQVVNHHAAQVNLRQAWDDPLGDARTNVLGSLVLLRQAVSQGVRQIIYSSSAAVYGEPSSLPVSEEHAIHPLSPYGVSKMAAELYLHSFAAEEGLRYIVLRYPNVYGPRQQPTGEAGVVALFTTQLLAGVRPRIFGDGSKTRDYVCVEDIVAANLRALEYEENGVFNLGWNREITDLEVFETVRAATGCGVEPIFELKRPWEIDRIRLDIRRARSGLEWTPRVEFIEGVTRLVAYWKQRYSPVPVNVPARVSASRT